MSRSRAHRMVQLMHNMGYGLPSAGHLRPRTPPVEDQSRPRHTPPSVGALRRWISHSVSAQAPSDGETYLPIGATGSARQPVPSAFWNSGGCWALLLLLLMLAVAAATTIIIVVLPPAQSGPAGGGSGTGAYDEAEPCTDFYNYVCHADPGRSAFRTLHERNSRLRETYLRATPEFATCTAVGGLAGAQMHVSSDEGGQRCDALPWADFVACQWRSGGAFPLAAQVDKAFHRPVHALTLAVDYTLARVLDEISPRAAALLYPSELIEPLYQQHRQEHISEYVTSYAPWAAVTPSFAFKTQVEAVFGETLTDATLVHVSQSSAAQAYHAHLARLCAPDRPQTASDRDCAEIKQALVQATHYAQPWLMGYSAHYSSDASTPGTRVRENEAENALPALHTVEWYYKMRAHVDSVLRTTPFSATEDATTEDVEKECLAIAGSLHHARLNRYVATQIYGARQLTLVEEELTSLTTHVRSSLARMVHGTGWLSSATRDAALSKLEDLQIYILAQAVDETACANEERDSALGWVQQLTRQRERRAAQNRARLAHGYREYRHASQTFRRQLLDETYVGIVNAWYNPTENTITIPVGILQAPFYHPPPADREETTEEERQRYWANLASVGMVLGHEMGHALDVHGRFFDYVGSWTADGWWTAEDQHKRHGFEDRLQCMAEDWGHPCDRQDYGMHTMGEDMADQLGLRAAYRLQEFGHTTDMQRFYEVYATVWCAKKTKHQECFQVMTDVHALPRHRVNKSLRQLDTFAAAYGCKDGDAMVNSKECLVY